MSRSVLLGRWLPVGAGVLVTLVLWLLVFLPYHRRAHTDTQKIDAIERELGTRLALLQQVPAQQKAIDSLTDYLRTFQTGLHRTNEVGALMRDLEARADDASVTFWRLDPSVPTLISLDDSPDSVATLQLAVLPVSFECIGDYVSLGKFLEAEERRAEFANWESLTISPKSGSDEIRVIGRANFYLLPVRTFAEDAR